MWVYNYLKRKSLIKKIFKAIVKSTIMISYHLVTYMEYLSLKHTYYLYINFNY